MKKRICMQFKRITAWILALCIISGTFPAYALESPEEKLENYKVISLDFRAEYKTAEGKTPLNASLAENKWQVNRERTAGSLLSGGTELAYKPYGISAAVNDAVYVKHAELSLDFEVATDGFYSVDLSGAQYPGKGVIAAVFVDDMYIGRYDFGAGMSADTENKDVGETVNLSEVSLDEGVHTVTFRRLSGGDKPNNIYIMPGCMTFKRIDEIRGQANINLVKVWDDAYAANGYSGSPSPAANTDTIDTYGWQINTQRTRPDLLDGLYSDFSYSNRGVYAELADMGYPKYGELAFDFTVPQDGLYSVKIGGSAGTGGIAAVHVDNTYIGTYDFSKAEESVFAAPVYLGNINLSTGKHTIAFQRVGGDAAFRLSYINLSCISEIAAEKTVDFRRLWSDTYYANIGKSDADKLAFPSPLDAQLATHGWEIDREKSAPATFSDYVPSSSNYGLYVRIADANIAKYADFAVKFTVDKTAEYRLAFNGAKVADGTICDIYLDDVKVGEYSFYASTYKMIGEDVDLGIHELDHTKEHTLTLRRIWESSGNWRLYPGSFRLLEVSEDKSAPLSLEAEKIETIALGGTKRSKITATVADEDVSLADAQFKIKSANEEIATADITASNDGSAILSVSGKGLGNTNINVIVLADERISSIDIPISVAPEDEFRGVVLTVDKTRLEVGDTAKAIAKALTMSDTEIPLDKNTLYFKSSAPEVASVDGAGNIVAKSQGDAEICAYVTVDGIVRQATVKITVTDSAPLVSAEIKNPGTISIGDKIQLEVLGVLGSGNAADMSAAEVTYSLLECSPQGAATLSESGMLSALQSGTVKVKADVTLNGVNKTTPELEFTISEISGDSIVLNFAANQQGNPIDKVIADDGWQVNKELSSYNTVTYPQYFAWQSYGFSARIWGVDDSVSADLSIDFNVPKAGAYNLEVGYYQAAAGGLSQVYVNGVYAGNIDFYSVDSLSKSTRLNSFNLNAGVNNITFRRTNWESGDLHYKVIENEGNYNHFTIASISFTPILSLPEIASVQVTSDDDIYSAGENGQINTVVTMTDGHEYSFGKLMSKVQDDKNKLVFENLTTDILTVNADGSFKAKAEGEGKIKVTAYVNGKAAAEPEICTVNVDNQRISAVNVQIKDEPLVIGEKCELIINATLEDGRAIDVSDLAISCTSANPDAVEIVSENGKYYVKGKTPGISQITLVATLNGQFATAIFDVEAHGEAFNAVEISTDFPFMRPTDNGTQLNVTAKTYLGTVVNIPDGAIEYKNSNPDCAQVDANGFVTPVALGSTTVTATVTIGDIIREGKIEITIREGKTKSTFYTQEKVEALRENVSRYSWARGDKDAVIKEADRLVELGYEYLWNAVTTQELPRSATVGYRYDPEAILCRYCGVDLQKKYGSPYVWKADPINSPWKIQCPDCRRQFPTNDFGSFYKLGIDENGNWSYEKSHREHYNLFKDEYAIKGVETYEEYDNMRTSGQRLPGVGYLKNQTATDVASVDTVNGGRGLGENETWDTWGVDDGYGYRTGEKYTGVSSFGAIDEVHTYIAFYNHFWLWYFDAGLITGGLNKLRDAYLITGDAKYGRAGAIMVDRIADIYPDMYAHRLADEDEPSLKMSLSDSTAPYGRIVGCIWEYPLMKKVILGYDAFFSMYQDKAVKSFLSEKAKQYNLKNSKDTAELLCTNIEDGILREFYKATVDGHSWGNFGTHQSGVAYAAVVLDTQPETNEWLDWMFRISPYSHSETKPNPGNTGGDVGRILVNTVDRDGMGDESSPQYSNLWVNNLQDIAEPLSGYVTDEKYDIYKHPKVRKMQTVEFDLITVGKATVQIGDSSGCANTSFNFYENYLLDFYKNTKDYRVGQILYFLNGNKTDGMHYDKFTKNPESLKTDIQKVIDTYGEYDFGKSTMLTGYGFSILRDGDFAKASLGEKDIDTQRDAWMYFGNALRHGHLSTLNLGLEAFGLNISPDNGYPESANGDDLMLNSNHASISHNVVLVDDRSQMRISRTGNPLHFNDSGRVKLMDADVPYTYDNTKIYRRSVLMIQATDDVSYYVDFFRVKGGDDHLYSFHALSDTLPEMDKTLTFVKQPMGSYAGPDIPVGTIGHSNGYTYFYDVHRADDPKVNEFYADFKIKDFRKTLGGDRDLNLRMTMLNDFNLSEVSLTKTKPPQVSGNPGALQYVFARRSGENLDSLFTTVFEPYEGNRYIKSMEKVSIAPVSGNAVGAAEAKAVKVTLESGREDYIIYAADNTREYIVDNKISFRGAFGVYSVLNDECVYSYVSDGTQNYNKQTEQGVKGEYAVLTGEIIDFTDTLSYENTITISLDQRIDPQTLAGKYIRINNDNEQNGVYGIKGAYIPDESKPDEVVLDIGDTTLVRRYKNSEDFDAGYAYNIEGGQTFDIPLTYVYDSSPVLNNVAEKTVAAGKKVTVNVSAVSPSGKELTYFIQNAPRGASFDEKNGIFTWTPDSKQVGVHPIIIGATDGVLSDTQVVKIEVAAAIGSGNTDDSDINSGSDESGTGSGTGAGGGAGGGTGGGGGTSSGGDTGNTETGGDNTDDDNTGDVGDGVLDVPSEKFIDLGNHSWAKDAIYALVDAGVVNGTSENTYAPAANIKRADFAIMLVRAFGIKSGEGTNFADVDASKYYAEELRLAKSNGIVNGIGSDKFNPEGEITRQDMMLMLTRALEAQGKALEEADESVLSQFVDAAEISDYARSAVASVVKAGVIAGSNGRINPLAKATRAEIAVMLDRVLTVG